MRGVNNNRSTENTKGKIWDAQIPPEKYFTELQRVSRHQIVWGYNYFCNILGQCKGVVVWDKVVSVPNFSAVELAYTTYDTPARLFKFAWNGLRQGYTHGEGKHNIKEKREARIHPAQKPVALYKWLLHNYAKPGDKILDTHVGSGSSIIACIDKGFDYMGFEIDADYYAAMQERIYHFTRQTSLIDGTT